MDQAKRVEAWGEPTATTATTATYPSLSHYTSTSSASELDTSYSSMQLMDFNASFANMEPEIPSALVDIILTPPSLTIH